MLDDLLEEGDGPLVPGPNQTDKGLLPARRIGVPELFENHLETHEGQPLTAKYVMDNEGDRIPAERIPLSARHRQPNPWPRHLIGFLALACSASAGQPVYATRDASAEDLPPHTVEVGRLAVDPAAALPPAAFTVGPDGRPLVLLPSPPRLVSLGPDGTSGTPRLLQGGGFQPAQAGPVDLALLPDGDALVLDAGAGTLWRVAPDGTVRSRHGLFVAPTRLRLGPEGRVLVADPGSTSVVVLNRDLVVEAVRRGEGLAPALTADLGVPFLRLRPDGSAAQLGLVPLQGASPSTERLAHLPAPDGYELMSAEVLGVDAEGVHVLTGSAQVGGSGSSFQVHTVPRKGEPPEPVAIPWLGSGCLDCGPTYRRGADGRLHGYLLRRDLYRVVRFDTEREDQG